MTTDDGLTYAAAGVDIDREAVASSIMFDYGKQTWGLRPDINVETFFDDFSGLRAFHIGGLPQGTYASIDPDGTGTKIKFGLMSGNFNTFGIDLVCMVAEDAARRGAEPIVMVNIVDVNFLGSDDFSEFHQLGSGLVAGAKLANTAVVNGEIAQLGDMVTGQTDRFGCIWNAALLWFGRHERLIDGRKVTNGDYLVGLFEPGLRANGISLVRRTLDTHYPNGWLTEQLDGRLLIDRAAEPSQIYTNAIVDMTGGYHPDREPKARIHGIAHISGGGLPEKLARMLRPSGCGARVYEPFPANALMLHCQELGNISDREAYRTWCMGHGMVIATPDPDAVVEVAQAHGFVPKVIGYVTNDPSIHITNMGLFRQEAVLVYE